MAPVVAEEKGEEVEGSKFRSQQQQQGERDIVSMLFIHFLQQITNQIFVSEEGNSRVGKK